MASRLALQPDVAALQAQIADLTQSNQDLQAALHAAYSGNINMQGYLLKHRPVTQLMGLFAQEWEMRYFVLCGTVLRYYKSERDAAMMPRGVVDIQGCLIEVEEVDKKRQWRFRIVEQGGNQLLRLGTDNQTVAERWLNCFEDVGLRVVPAGQPTGHTQDASSLATKGKGGYPDKRVQDRWEASSTDSELPEAQVRTSQSHHRRRRPSHPVTPTRPAQAPAPATASSASAAAATMAADVAAATSFCQGASSRTAPASSPSATAGGVSSSLQKQRSGTVPGEAAPRKAERPPMSGSTPVHTTIRYSYLSSDGIWMAKHDGLLNLCIIILIATNFRLILENLLKYGWRLNFINYVSRSLAGRGNLPLVLAFPALVMLSLLALATEKLGWYCLKVEEEFKSALAKKSEDDKAALNSYQSRMRQTDVLLFVLHLFCCAAALLLPCIVIHLTQADAVPGIMLMLWTLTVWMKLVSYAHCHSDLRTAHRANELRPGERGAPGSSPEWAILRYPENLTISNMLYYLAVPTLTYQVNFPRTTRVRKRWLLRRVLELACFAGLLLFIANQYLEPAVSNALQPLSQSDWVRVAERVLKLALPNLYAWLCMFYCLFHLHLNIIAELTRFGDREFYKDWWNAATIGDYWKLWNMPVHKWLLRTVYFPAMNWGLGRYTSMVLVFFVSAVAHEVVVGVPLHMVRGWSFFGIMFQVPLISITESLKKRLKSDTWGNYMFWLTFCIIGQPVSLLMYVHDYMFQHTCSGRDCHPILNQTVAAGDY